MSASKPKSLISSPQNRYQPGVSNPFVKGLSVEQMYEVLAGSFGGFTGNRLKQCCVELWLMFNNVCLWFIIDWVLQAPTVVRVRIVCLYLCWSFRSFSLCFLFQTCNNCRFKPNGVVSKQSQINYYMCLLHY